MEKSSSLIKTMESLEDFYKSEQTELKKTIARLLQYENDVKEFKSVI